MLRTGEGAAIVDTMTFNWQGAGIPELVRTLPGGRVGMIVNTHDHIDHRLVARSW